MRSRVRMTARRYRLLALIVFVLSMAGGMIVSIGHVTRPEPCTIDCMMTARVGMGGRVMVGLMVAAPGVFVAFLLSIVAAAGDGPLNASRPQRRSRWLGTVGRRELGSGAVRPR